MKRTLVTVLLSLCSHVFGQEILTLQTCLDLLEKHSLLLSAESASLRRSQVDKHVLWWDLLPNLDATSSLNTSFGRRLDPFTNTFATSSVNSQSFGLNSNVQLFRGFAHFYKRTHLMTSIRQGELELAARRNELQMQVIEAYVSLVKLSVQSRLSESRIAAYQQIQTLQQSLIREGRIHAIDTLKSHQSLLTAQDVLLKFSNESKLRRIQLNFLIGLPLGTDYLPDMASISAINPKPRLEGMYLLETVEIEAALLQSQFQLDRAEFLPSVSLNGLIGTGFSTNNKDYLDPANPTKPYGSQLRENLYEGIGFYLSVPLFRRGEWLKTKQLHAIRQTELAAKKEWAEWTLEKQRFEQQQKQVHVKAELEHSKRLAANLELIYTKSLLLYEAGRLTYAELEAVLLEWQEKELEAEVLGMDYEVVVLVE